MQAATPASRGPVLLTISGAVITESNRGALHPALDQMMVKHRVNLGKALALGGLGPQWADYDADNLTDFMGKPLKQRFGLCPWGAFHIDVKPV